MLSKQYYLERINDINEELSWLVFEIAFNPIELKEVLSKIEVLFFSLRDTYPSLAEIQQLKQLKLNEMQHSDIEIARKHLLRFKELIYNMIEHKDAMS